MGGWQQGHPDGAPLSNVSAKVVGRIWASIICGRDFYPLCASAAVLGLLWVLVLCSPPPRPPRGQPSQPRPINFTKVANLKGFLGCSDRKVRGQTCFGKGWDDVRSMVPLLGDGRLCPESPTLLIATHLFPNHHLSAGGDRARWTIGLVP